MELYLDFESILRVALAAGAGAVLGLERHMRGRAAGLRTNALVCMASALLIVVSRGAAMNGLASDTHFQLNVDPSRMAAGIVTGIGFLGAGAIMRLKESLIRGLTTAAEIWFVAAVGISIGIGAYVLAGVAVCLALAILVGLHAVERRVNSVVYRTLTVDTALDQRIGIEAACRATLNAEAITVQETGYSIDQESQKCRLTFSIRSENKLACVRVIGPLAEVAGIEKLELV
jgi:putative Mg2+ transporter-C (MgtC) family protein